MNNHTQTAEIYRSRVRIETLETAIHDNHAELLQRIEALETALATVVRALAYGETTHPLTSSTAAHKHAIKIYPLDTRSD